MADIFQKISVLPGSEQFLDAYGNSNPVSGYIDLNGNVFKSDGTPWTDTSYFNGVTRSNRYGSGNQVVVNTTPINNDSKNPIYDFTQLTGKYVNQSGQSVDQNGNVIGSSASKGDSSGKVNLKVDNIFTGKQDTISQDLQKIDSKDFNTLSNMYGIDAANKLYNSTTPIYSTANLNIPNVDKNSLINENGEVLDSITGDIKRTGFTYDPKSPSLYSATGTNIFNNTRIDLTRGPVPTTILKNSPVSKTGIAWDGTPAVSQDQISLLNNLTNQVAQAHYKAAMGNDTNNWSNLYSLQDKLKQQAINSGIDPNLVVDTFANANTQVQSQAQKDWDKSNGGGIFDSFDNFTQGFGNLAVRMAPAIAATYAAPFAAEYLAGLGAQAGGTGLTAGTGGSGGLLNASAGGAFSPAGAMATQSAAGLGGAGTGIISGLAPSSVGMLGTAGAGSLAGIAGTQAAAGLGGANLGIGLTADQLAGYESAMPSSNFGTADIGLGTNAPLQGPTYQELGVTGVPEGGMGPTYGEMGYTGLNNAEAIAAADAAAAAANSPSLGDIAKAANTARQTVGTGSTLAKLLSGGAGTKTGVTPTAQQLASLLGSRQPVTAALPGIYNMNQNPFSFGSAVPLTSGAYDVSGGTGTTLSNQKLANLLK